MSKVKVICVNGFSRTGKSTFVELMKKKAPVVIGHSTIDTVKKALITNGLLRPDSKGPKERAFLASVKKSWRDYNDGPLKEVIEKVKEQELIFQYMSNIDRVLSFVHVREPEEIKKIVDYFHDAVTIVVTRPNIKRQPGDEEVYNWKYDFEVYNDGDLSDLDTIADYFLEFLNERRC